ncbi:MAG: sigma-70 family RNA polymerase sigma factor [Calditrichaceae bacterium]|nr:sigma-70 family RNA polymerase sigma factor [Calditrichaceae bacterium]
MEPETVNTLVGRIIGGDALAERELFDHFKDEVEFLVKWKIGKKNPDWEDLLQEIFVALFQRLREGQYDGQKGRLGAFLQSIIKFKIMDYRKSPVFRRRCEYEDIFDNDMEDTTKNPEEAFEEAQERQLLKKAIVELDELYKEILFLSIYKQLKVREISKMKGLPEQKVSNLKSYALSLLKEKFGNKG